MTNLATLIGVKNLESLMANPENNYVVLDNGNVFDYVKNTSDVNFGSVVGIGSFKDCQTTAWYLNTLKIALS